MKICQCSPPRPNSNLRADDVCLACGFHLPSADTGPFFDMLAAIVRPDYLSGEPPMSFEAFRALCEAREIAGRPRFGLHFYARDNVVEALEEAADGANYAAFESLVMARAGGDDDDHLLILAAHYFELAHRALLQHRQNRPRR